MESQDSRSPIHVWTDGSFFANGACGWAFIAERNGLRLHSGKAGCFRPGAGATYAERKAVQLALASIPEDEPLVIHADNGGVTKVCKNGRKVEFKIIRRHSHPNHYEAHKMAYGTARQLKGCRQIPAERPSFSAPD